MRLIDRPLRPLFPKDYRNDVQIIITALSSDGQNYLDIPAIIGASAALTISDVPFEGPIAACRVGMIEEEFIVNPTAEQLEQSKLDLRMAGTKDAILMVEAGAKEVQEEVILQALQVGHEAMQPLIALQEQMREEIGKPKYTDYPVITIEERDRERIVNRIGNRVAELVARPMGKKERDMASGALEDEILGSFVEDETIDPKDIKKVFRDVLKAETRQTGPGKWSAGRWPEDRRDPRHLGTHRALAPGARIGALYTGRDTGVEHCHPGHPARGTEAGHTAAGRDQALHAPLQLPTL